MNATNYDPEYLLFAQHGWGNTGDDIGKLAEALAKPNSIVIAPSFDWVKTTIRINPLIREVEKLVEDRIFNYPRTPIRIITHSIGGIIWLEVLNKNEEWRAMVHSLVLIGCPVGGTDLSRVVDSFGIGIGIARDLGRDRRVLAGIIAQEIPTLSIASNLNSGTDGLVSVENTQFDHAHCVTLSDIRHADLKRNPKIVPIIQNFWANLQMDYSLASDLAIQVIKRLQAVPGMMDAHRNGFDKSQLVISLQNGVSIHSWTNALGMHHVFVSDQEKQCIYAGYVNSIHSSALSQALEEFKQTAIAK
ncbi:MAG: hypothetical protein Tsb0014_12010 [Pleurocapsa sp.]